MRNHRQGCGVPTSIETITREIIDERLRRSIGFTVECTRPIRSGLQLGTGCRRADNRKVDQRLMELFDRHLPLKVVQVNGLDANRIVQADGVTIGSPQRHWRIVVDNALDGTH